MTKAEKLGLPKNTKVAWKEKGDAIAAAGVQTCTKCNITKPLNDFPQHRKNRFGKPRYSYCKLCHSDYQRYVRLRREFHITEADYKAIELFQNGACALCEKAPLPGHNKLSVDHRHTDGLLRGLLCWTCNRLLGCFRDNVAMLQRAVDYLQNPPITRLFGYERFTAPGRIGTKKRAKVLKEMKAKGGCQYAVCFVNGQGEVTAPSV